MTIPKSNNMVTELSISIVIAITLSSALSLKMFKKQRVTTMTMIIVTKHL